jgi:hypothetical protein
MADTKENEIALRISEANVQDPNSSNANGAVNVPTHIGELEVLHMVTACSSFNTN